MYLRTGAIGSSLESIDASCVRASARPRNYRERKSRRRQKCDERKPDTQGDIHLQ